MGARLGAIALLAMLVRAVVPAGFMLAEAETANGRYLTVDFCEGHGPVKRVLDTETRELLDPSEIPAQQGEVEGNSPPCVFAAAAPLAPPVVDFETIEFAVFRHVEFTTVRDVRPGRGIPAPPPPATGPPAMI